MPWTLFSSRGPSHYESRTLVATDSVQIHPAPELEKLLEDKGVKTVVIARSVQELTNQVRLTGHCCLDTEYRACGQR
jgi:hypothetical protein